MQLTTTGRGRRKALRRAKAEPLRLTTHMEE
jgi:hypothetical protein